MPIAIRELGDVLTHIYDFPFWAAIYLPEVAQYAIDTPCIVPEPVTWERSEEAALHQICLKYGFKNWLNVAMVSDICEEVLEQDQETVIAAFNASCAKGGGLAGWMNWRREEVPAPET